MVKSYWFDELVGIVRFTGASDSTFADRHASILEMIEDHDLPQECGVLINVSSVREPIDIDDMSVIGVLVLMLCRRFGKRVAIVNCKVGHSSLSFMAAAMTRDDKCRAFVHEPDAVEWLTKN